MVIRAAYPEDAAELANVNTRAWQQAYIGLIPDAFLSSLDVAKRAERWRIALEHGTPTVLLDFDENEKLAGFAAFGAARDAEATSDWAELRAIYYLQEYWGSGRAQRLWTTVWKEICKRGYRKITLWVLDGNNRAVSFYRKQGFELDGTERHSERGGRIQTEVRMVAEIP